MKGVTLIECMYDLNTSKRYMSKRPFIANVELIEDLQSFRFFD